MNTLHLIIRRATEKDSDSIAALADISHQFYRSLMPHFLAPLAVEYWKKRFLHALQARNYHTFAAELPTDDGIGKKAGTVVGYIEVFKKETESSMVRPAVRGVIDNLAVHPDYRRLGIGALLLHHAEKVAKEFGAEMIELQVAAENPGAQALYIASGYQARNVTMEKLLT